MWVPVSQRMITYIASIAGFKILKFRPLPPNERVSPQRDVWRTVQSVQFIYGRKHIQDDISANASLIRCACSLANERANEGRTLAETSQLILEGN